jgi:hypothetical protein
MTILIAAALAVALIWEWITRPRRMQGHKPAWQRRRRDLADKKN